MKLLTTPGFWIAVLAVLAAATLPWWVSGYILGLGVRNTANAPMMYWCSTNYYSYYGHDYDYYCC